MTSSSEKLRAIVLSTLMVMSVFGGVVAFSGSVAANAPDPGTYGAANYGGDNTQDTNTTRNRIVEIADLNFSSAPGNVSEVNVSANDGGNSVGISASDVTSVTVALYNSAGDEIASESAPYDSNLTTVDVDPNIENDSVARMTVTATVSGTASNGDVIDAGVEIFAPEGDSFSGTSSPYDTQNNQTVFVGTGNESYLRGTVQDQSGSPIEDATVDIIDVDTGTVVATVETRSDGEWGNVRVGPGTYRVEIFEPGFETFSATREVNAGETEDIPATLISNRFADDLSVGVWDPSSQLDVGDDSTLPADNQSSTKQSYVVYADDQLNEPLQSNLSVTLQFTNSTTIGDFVDNSTIETTKQITIVASQQADVDDDGAAESYANIEVTSDNASANTFDAVGTTGAIRTEMFNATAINAEGDELADRSNVTYALGGDENIVGTIRQVTEDGSSSQSENVTVWAAYDGGNQTQAFAEQFSSTLPGVDLVQDTDATGHYQLYGLAGNNTSINVYAKKPGFNRLNVSGVPGLVALAEQNEHTAGPGSKTQEINGLIFEAAVNFEYQIDLKIENSTGVFVDSECFEGSAEVAMANGESREVRVHLEARQIGSAGDFQPISDTVTVDLDPGTAADLDNSSVTDDTVTVTTGADGNATVTFEASNSATGIEHINGSITNDLGDTYWDEECAEVFGAGEVSGDVVDENIQPVASTTEQSVYVNLWWWNTTSNQYEPAADAGFAANNRVETSEFGTDQAGHYAFTDVRTHEQYKVNVTVVDESTGNTQNPPGFAVIPNKQPGTSTADIVLSVAREDIFENTITINDQESDGSSVTVAAAQSAEAAFLVIRNESGGIVAVDDVLLNNVAVSAYTVSLDTPLTSDQQVTAAIHHDDGDATFDEGADQFVTNDTAQIDVTGDQDGGLVDQYDTNGTPGIQIDELGDAAQDYATGALTINELSQVAAAYAS